MSQASHGQTAPGARSTVPHKEDLGPDPLASLYKMSTTAGATSQQYVAVNGAAVIAALLGVASALVFFTPLMLCIPVIGLICGLLAIRQIHNSNGTQTGRILAVAGLLMSLGFGGTVGVREVAQRWQTYHDERQIAVIVNQLGDELHSGQYSSAYNLFESSFKSKVRLEVFTLHWKVIERSVGKILALRWNGVAPSYSTGEGGATTAMVEGVLTVEQGEDRLPVSLRKSANGWEIQNVGEIFSGELDSSPWPQTPPAGAGGASGGAPSPPR